MPIKFVLFLWLIPWCYSCQNNENSAVVDSNSIGNQITTTQQYEPKTIAYQKDTLSPQDSLKLQGVCTEVSPLQQKTFSTDYLWLQDYTLATALERQIAVPNGYQRVVAAENSFGAWLRGLPLEEKGKPVLLYNGTTKSYQEGAHRVVKIDIGTKDLQQCADAIMRLKAEYYYSKKEYEQIHFNYTSGHTVRFSDWSKGKKPQISGNKVSFSSPSGSTDVSYSNFKKYLTNIFNYAGTASLSKELKSKKVADIEIGDIFIWGGFPGHAILVVDVAKHSQTGKKIFLLAQSYMPAQSIHILKNFNDSDLSPWYSEDFGEQLLTPEWTFERESLKELITDN
jgi:hypothetical protein